METADAVVKQVEDYVADEKTSGRSGMPFWGLPESAEEQNRLAKKWQDWRPSGVSRP